MYKGVKTILVLTSSLDSDKHFLLPCLAENIRQDLDEGYVGCDISVDLQIAFDSVEHAV